MALSNGRITPGTTHFLLHSPAVMRDRLECLRRAFPAGTLHAVAIKAQSDPLVLRKIAEWGYGLEAASFEEVLLAQNAGVSADRIVFDSPVKTRQEIDLCHRNFPGMLVNANSLQELVRYPDNFSGRLGLRINPQVQSDAPGAFNVTTDRSKFGVPIAQREQIIAAALRFPMIRALHMHIGSDIHQYTAQIKAVRRILELAKAIEERRKEQSIRQQIDTIDIGGGIHFSAESGIGSVDNYVAQLAKTGIFEKYRVVTEFGKFIHTEAGALVSDIEYISEFPQGASILYIHAGADLFVRKAYSDLPIDYPVRLWAKGDRSLGRERKYDIAGPLCFAGDFIARNIPLPEAREGDRLIVRNVGANTLSMWSHHCNRTPPPLLLMD